MAPMKNIIMAVIVLFCVASFACGGKYEVPDTVGEACFDIGQALCERMVECNIAFDNVEVCVTDFITACCTASGECDDPANINANDDEWGACLEAFDEFACSPLDQGGLPLECTATI